MFDPSWQEIAAVIVFVLAAVVAGGLIVAAIRLPHDSDQPESPEP